MNESHTLEEQFTEAGTAHPIRSRYDDPSRPEETDNARAQVRKAIVYSLTRRPFTALTRGISPSEWNLDGFRSRFYRQYPAKQDAVEDTLREGIHPNRSELTDALTERMAAYASAVDHGALPSDILQALGNAYFAQSINDDVLALQMLAWVAAREHTSLTDDFERLYGSLDKRTVDGLSTMLEGWDRTPIAPFSWSDIATTLTALTEGLLIRHAVNPDAVPVELLGQVATGIVASMTKHASEPIDHIHQRVDLPGEHE